MTDVTTCKGKKMGSQKSFKTTFQLVNKPGATCRNIYVRRKHYAKSSNLISLNSLSILLSLNISSLASVVSTLLYHTRHDRSSLPTHAMNIFELKI